MMYDYDHESENERILRQRIELLEDRLKKLRDDHDSAWKVVAALMIMYSIYKWWIQQ